MPSSATSNEDWQIDDSIGSFEDAVLEIGRRVKSRKEPVPTTGYFGRKTEPGDVPALISVGDTVRWNGQYRGTVTSVNCETAVVFERHNFALGHPVKWRIRVDALTRILERIEGQDEIE